MLIQIINIRFHSPFNNYKDNRHRISLLVLVRTMAQKIAAFTSFKPQDVVSLHAEHIVMIVKTYIVTCDDEGVHMVEPAT